MSEISKNLVKEINKHLEDRGPYSPLTNEITLAILALDKRLDNINERLNKTEQGTSFLRGLHTPKA